MSFVDTVQITLKAGSGGNGLLSFRHEKYISHGGPDGGDGGNGGDIVFIASQNQNTLANFRYKKELKALPGSPGSNSRKHGRNGLDLDVQVPVGTSVISENGEMLADLLIDGGRVIIAKGGKGGYGNAHFVSSVRQAPRIAEIGEPGEELNVTLELKLIADVGLVGLPNAGKSTLLSVISNAHPEIADYPFTTLTPHLGVVDIDKSNSLLFADIPGLIEGAAQGRGLGDEFLRHIERTSVLIHLIDAYQDDIVKAYIIIQNELKSYKIDLSQRPQVLAINKVEGLDKKNVDGLIKRLQKVTPDKTPILAISAQAKTGTTDLLRQVLKMVEASKKKEKNKIKESEDEIPVIRLADSENTWQIERVGNRFLLTGNKIERFAQRTNFASEDGTQRLYSIMKKMGIMHELTRQGLKSGQVIVIGKAGQLKY